MKMLMLRCKTEASFKVQQATDGIMSNELPNWLIAWKISNKKQQDENVNFMLY